MTAMHISFRPHTDTMDAGDSLGGHVVLADEGNYTIAKSGTGNLFPAVYKTSAWPFFAHLHDSEMPCAVCERDDKGSKTIVYPGTTACPTTFRKDYDGS